MSTVKSRNVILDDRRTSLRLELAIWDALEEICAREGITLNQLCMRVERQRGPRSLAAAIRVYALQYFREAATEPGHAEAGHGSPSDG